MTLHELSMLAAGHGSLLHRIHMLTSGPGGAIAFAVCIVFLIVVAISGLLRSR